jgi:hypothetical protein
MPPAPIAALISYAPSRVPGGRLMATPDYRWIRTVGPPAKRHNRRMDPVLRDQARAFFGEVPAALAVYMFGSIARGTASPGSDNLVGTVVVAGAEGER